MMLVVDHREIDARAAMHYPEQDMSMDARQQAALTELSQSALAGTDLPTLMRQAVVLVARTLDVEYSKILESLPDRSTVVLRAGVGWQEGTVEHAAVEQGSASPAGYALLDNAPVIVEDWRSETRFSQPPLLRDHGVVCSLYIIIHGHAHPFGVLGVDSAVRRTFTDDELHFLQAVANLLAMAVENARLVAVAQGKAVLEERQRLARDLHDSVTQSLYSITLHAEAATRLLSSGNVDAAGHYLRELQDTAQEALEEMRLLIFELRPPVLDREGLAAALQARLEVVEGRANLRTELIVEGVGRLPPPIEQALYRIAQEALNNALKHARAESITVSLRQEQSTVLLEITDDGVGIDPAAARDRAGLGLRGIEERVTQLGGQLTLQSAPGAGMQVRVELSVW